MQDSGEMLAVIARESGGADVLGVVRRPIPVPGDGEVLIRVDAAGVNRPDVLQRQGIYPPPPGAGDILGLEVAGRVMATGRDVTSPGIGDPVCALVSSGGYATHCVAPAGQCLPVPQGVSVTDAAGIPETFFTVWSNLFDRARLSQGETLLVHGGSGGIGTTAIQLARALGVTVHVTAGSQDKLDFCVQLGATRAINRWTEDFPDVIRKETGGRGVDVILDIVGGEYTQGNLRSLAMDGRLVQLAWMGSSVIAADFMVLMTRRLTWTGSTMRPQSVASKQRIAHALSSQVWPLFGTGKIRTITDSVFPLADVARAHGLMESGRHKGKILLDCRA